jgi:hypothetical protein
MTEQEKERLGLLASIAAVVVSLIWFAFALGILTVDHLRTIAFVVGVSLLAFVIWRFWIYMDHKTYESWKRKVERQSSSTQVCTTRHGP